MDNIPKLKAKKTYKKFNKKREEYLKFP